MSPRMFANVMLGTSFLLYSVLGAAAQPVVDNGLPVYCPYDLVSAVERAAPKIRILTGARTTASDVRFFSFSCEVSHSNKAPLMFVGYRADSFDPPIADGNISPIHVIQSQQDGKWKEHPQGWCGTGIDGNLLPAGQTKTFGFAVPVDLAGKVVRVGIRWSRPQEFAVAKPESFSVAWSNPFELKQIDDGKEKSGTKAAPEPGTLPQMDLPIGR